MAPVVTKKLAFIAQIGSRSIERRLVRASSFNLPFDPLFRRVGRSCLAFAVVTVD